VTIEVVALGGSRVRLGISAPPDTPVHRTETWERICASGGTPSQGNGSAARDDRSLPAVSDGRRPPRPPASDLKERLARRIVERTGGRIRSLSVNTADGRIVVEGRAPSYYARQLALAAVKEALNGSASHGSGEVDFAIKVEHVAGNMAGHVANLPAAP